MSHVIELTDEQYDTLRHAAEERGETLDRLLMRVVEELRDQRASAHPAYPAHPAHAYTTEEWFRHLGATEEQIAEARRIARERSDADA